MSGLLVKQPGMLSLLQDGGRIGHHRIGLTNGGPLDREAMYWANRLLDNKLHATVLEVSFGGLELEARINTAISVTGGDAVLAINGVEKALWRSHNICAGDRISLGFASTFCRSYLAVHGGFAIAPQFGSTATVPREGIGGLTGKRLDSGELLPCSPAPAVNCQRVREQDLPRYQNAITVRVVPGYQQRHFNTLQQRRFYCSEYTVTDRADRMGYRLEGPAIQCAIEGILSEGICHGAIQIPADGQPIVLLNDRQTIGGYPKIGSALSLDTTRLAQLMPGGRISFAEISLYEAHNALHLAHRRFLNAQPEPCRA